MKMIPCFLIERIETQNEEEDRWHRLDTGETFEKLADVPIGAMYFAPWIQYGSIFFTKRKEAGDDRGALIVRTPGGFWNIDSKSSNGDGWQWSGDPPKITATPSIVMHDGYHGWLRDGCLVEA